MYACVGSKVYPLLFKVCFRFKHKTRMGANFLLVTYFILSAIVYSRDSMANSIYLSKFLAAKTRVTCAKTRVTCVRTSVNIYRHICTDECRTIAGIYDNLKMVRSITFSMLRRDTPTE